MGTGIPEKFQHLDLVPLCTRLRREYRKVMQLLFILGFRPRLRKYQNRTE
jgi:hypothetical protein